MVAGLKELLETGTDVSDPLLDVAVEGVHMGCPWLDVAVEAVVLLVEESLARISVPVMRDEALEHMAATVRQNRKYK
ncbi:MAG: hypothetical protein GOMPHAMPRED_001168 [Gomphillus americanus]|uniref:Uncharacterized protein n=1 Tax=Gomphillus americanus TaxID=1940652 RepID=A0A8H3F0E9_9LECA|nr:MAG: hypothetical protein GOMPHAMPRED_001168 [Gomphillus americanus]